MSDDVGNRMRFSLKLLEYLSMRKIVVGHLVGPSKDCFSDYCVLAHNDIKNFSDKIIGALNTTPAVKDARSYIVEHHDWGVVKKSIKEALSDVI